jgi:hypothetical protein
VVPLVLEFLDYLYLLITRESYFFIDHLSFDNELFDSTNLYHPLDLFHLPKTNQNIEMNSLKFEFTHFTSISFVTRLSTKTLFTFNTFFSLRKYITFLTFFLSSGTHFLTFISMIAFISFNTLVTFGSSFSYRSCWSNYTDWTLIRNKNIRVWKECHCLLII